MLGRWTLQRVWRDRARPTWASAAIGSFKSPRHSHHCTKLNGIHSISKKTPCILQQHECTLRLDHCHRPRTLFTAAIPTILVPPLIFVGLLISLWTWKCFWIVLMQDKLLYLSWLPPFARSEKIADYEAECRPVQWAEKQIRSLDGTKLAVCEGRIPVPDDLKMKREKSVVICYFQGNGGSTPMRLPLLSQILQTITSSLPNDVNYTVVALSYRGYWTSSGRATQSGIERDAQAFLDWVSETYARPDTDLEIILWGHSLGTAIASTATATYLSRHSIKQQSIFNATSKTHPPAPIAGLILEAPVSSTKDMLISLYPQKWLPYRYLWPFLWNNWNSTTALERIARWRDQSNHQDDSGVLVASGVGTGVASRPPPILLLCAAKDEVIPLHAADELEAEGKKLGLDIMRKDVPGAMHIEAPLKIDGRKTMINFISKSISGS